jgi:hypothetical protein
MIYTSYFSNPLLKKILDNRKVAISIGVPRGWKHQRCLALAPTWGMLKMQEAEYYKNYDRILEKVSAVDIATQYDGCVLLCWEKNPAECHRSYVVKWLKDNGYEAQELTGDSLAVGRQTLNL